MQCPILLPRVTSASSPTGPVTAPSLQFLRSSPCLSVWSHTTHRCPTESWSSRCLGAQSMLWHSRAAGRSLPTMNPPQFQSVLSAKQYLSSWDHPGNRAPVNPSWTACPVLPLWSDSVPHQLRYISGGDVRLHEHTHTNIHTHTQHEKKPIHTDWSPEMALWGHWGQDDWHVFPPLHTTD